MAFTSIKNEPCRIKKQLEISTNLGRYMNDVPGPGDDVAFCEDPHIRLQGWGANLRTNTINLESALLGLNRPLNHDCMEKNNYKDHQPSNRQYIYGSSEPFVEQSRTIMPAWTLRDAEQGKTVPARWNYLHEDPQEHYGIPFVNCTNTRLGFKDNYERNCLSK